MAQEPNKSRVINNYGTKNLNKAAFLLMHGATFDGCLILKDDPIAMIRLSNVNVRHRDEFWKDDITIELWSFIRMRKWLKEKIKEERQIIKTSENTSNHLQID